MHSIWQTHVSRIGYTIPIMMSKRLNTTDLLADLVVRLYTRAMIMTA
jgi:hypothetical protein